MALTTGKTAEVMFDEALDMFESQQDLLPLVNFEEPDPAKMQNADNFIWRSVQQHSAIIDGWDLTGEEQGIIEETYPAVLGTPTGNFVRQRADKLRDKTFWERQGKESGRRQASNLNSDIAAAIAAQGSLFVRTNATSGFEAIANAQAIMNERQLVNNGRTFMLNDRDSYLYAKDLAARQTLQGKPDQAWAKGQIGANIAGFDIYTGSFLPNLTGGADPATTVTGNQSFAPEGGTVNATTGVVTNVDYRSASIEVAASTNYNINDKVMICNSGVPVYALGLDDKTNTGQPMTFTIVAKADATHVTVYPKPIAADDAALTTLEKAYANIDTVILNGATVNRLNTDSTNKTNLFWDKSAIEVMGGTIPASMFAELSGNKVLTETMSNGLTMYMLYDGNIATMNFRYRIFAWYGITVMNPQNCGVLVTY